MGIQEDINQSKFRNEYQKAGINIIYTFNWLDSFFISFLKPFGITSQQFNVLRILRGQHPKPASVKLIRERMLDKMSDASRIVEKLRVKGLLERNTSSEDRRSCDVCITEKGLNLLSKIDEKNETSDGVFSTLTEAEIKKLNQLLDKLRG